MTCHWLVIRYILILSLIFTLRCHMKWKLCISEWWNTLLLIGLYVSMNFGTENRQYTKLEILRTTFKISARLGRHLEVVAIECLNNSCGGNEEDKERLKLWVVQEKCSFILARMDAYLVILWFGRCSWFVCSDMMMEGPWFCLSWSEWPCPMLMF